MSNYQKLRSENEAFSGYQELSKRVSAKVCRFACPTQTHQCQVSARIDLNFEPIPVETLNCFL